MGGRDFEANVARSELYLDGFVGERHGASATR